MYNKKNTNATDQLRKGNTMKKVGILGGTFNPPHSGHLSIAESLLAEFSLDEILFLPVGLPPHKRSLEIASNEHRIKMLQILTAHDPRMIVSDLEMNRSGYTYTVDTLTELKNTVTDSIFYYIIGTDTLLKLTSWMRFEEVFRLTKFLCIPRPGDNPDEVKNEIQNLSQKYGAEILLSRSSGPDISSTMVRRMTAAGETLCKVVPEKLEEYIKNNGLFR